jgi:hypothetical protein
VGFSRSRPWRFDEATGWRPGAPNPHLLEGLEPVALADGRVAVLATVHGPTCETRVHTLLDIYDPRTDDWASGSALPQARVGFSAVRVPDGRLLILGGEHPYIEEPCKEPTDPLPPAILVDLPAPG